MAIKKRYFDQLDQEWKEIWVKTNPFENFSRQGEVYSKELNPAWDVLQFIGNEGGKTIHDQKGGEVRWDYRKRSGEHKKDSGLIILLDSKKSFGHLDVLRGKAYGIYIWAYGKEAKTAKKIEAHKEMPIYDKVQSLLKYD
jgi:hypothetical protein